MAIGCLVLTFALCARAEVPMSGKADPKYAKLDQVIQQLMQEHGATAAVVAVRGSNRVIYERGYGWTDQAKTKPTQPNSLFRIASLSKPITGAAIDTLIRQKKFTLQSKAFDLIDIKPPAGATVDPRLKSITVEHLLNHQGGWDRKETTDQTWNVSAISEALSLDRPPTPEEIISYMMGQPLDFDPGARRAYSNVGYMVLGLIIKKHGGGDYYAFTRRNVLEPLNIRDAIAARSLLKDADPREVWYSDDRMSRSVVEPDNTEKVQYAYGGFNLEYRYAVGGWVISAGSYARFMEAWLPHGDRYERGKRSTHSGSQPGVRGIAIWRGDGGKMIALFNRRIEADIADLFNAALDEAAATPVRTAPAR
jgi:N-acyl-D-amino-acid deacylase